MLTIEAYQEQQRTGANAFEPKAFNFRGNPENKEFIAKFAADNNFKTEGQALDFIVQVFERANLEAEQYNDTAQMIATQYEEIEALKIERDKWKEQAGRSYTITADLLANYGPFQEIKNQLSETLPQLYDEVHPQLKEVQRLPITDREVLTMICDYVQRDPTNEFPLQEATDPIVLSHINPSNETEAQKD